MKKILHMTLLACLMAGGVAMADEQLRLRSAIDSYLDTEWGEGNVEWQVGKTEGLEQRAATRIKKNI